jgi:hypothetical protein
MQEMGTEYALMGMVLVGVLLCLMGFWIEIRHRRHEQRQETRRRNLFGALHTAGDFKSTPSASEMDGLSQAAPNGT